jgi:hypothetical protein
VSALVQKQTFAMQTGTSALPQERTCAVHWSMSAKGRRWQLSCATIFYR